MFQTLDQFIKGHGDGAQDDDGGDNHVELEDLRSVDDQLAEAPSRSKKFTDDDAYQ